MSQSTRKYSRTHEWVQVENNIATIGISDFAVKELTDLVYIDLAPVGKTLSVGQTFGEVESVKAVSDLYAPVAGEVVAVNDKLAGDLAVLSSDPFGKGWMIKIRMSDSSNLDQLLDQAAYQQHCQSSH